MIFNTQSITALFAFFLLSGSVFANPKLPENLEWLTNEEDPVFSSPDAVKGGSLRAFILSFPMTLRTVGPDSNSGLVRSIRGNTLPLVISHPNTGKLLPSIATHWAYGDDNKTMYFKLNPKARWTDGKPVTAEDFAFTMEFMRSKELVAPWYNTYYTDEIGGVVIFDKHTISVSTTTPRPKIELPEHVSITPQPRHFYKDMKGFVKKYNWKPAPNSGPYYISEIKKGKSITFRRKKNWWAKDLKYYKNRFNVDKVKYIVIRDQNLAMEHFKKGKLDMYGLRNPLDWHEKAKGEAFDNGYVHKLWFYKDAPASSQALWLNQDNPILKDKNVRYGIAHALNLEKVNQQVLRGDYVRKRTVSDGYGDFTNKTIKLREFDLEKANEYFDKAGWKQRGADGIRVKDGKRLSLSVTYGYESLTPRLVVIKEEFKRAGFEMKLRKLDSAASFKSIQEKKFEMWWWGYTGGAFPQYWGQFHSVNAHVPNTNNASNMDDPELDKVIEAYRSSMNTEERIELAHKIQQIIHDNAAWIPTLDTPYERLGYWRWIKFPEIAGTRLGGAGAFPFDLYSAFIVSDGGLFWIDKKIKKETLAARKKGKKFPPVTKVDTTYKAAD